MKQPVEHLVLMGVAGCGKTTAAINLHNALGRPVAEADDFHPEANIAKMSRGAPLTDEDRRPWLESLRAWMSEQADRGTRTIVTCSALKRSYRDLLAGAHGRVFFIHLVADEAALHERMGRREGHFMPPALLPSQFADLEPLADDEDGVTVISRPTPEQTLEAILAAPDRSPDHRQPSPTRRMAGRRPGAAGGLVRRRRGAPGHRHGTAVLAGASAGSPRGTRAVVPRPRLGLSHRPHGLHGHGSSHPGLHRNPSCGGANHPPTSPARRSPQRRRIRACTVTRPSWAPSLVAA